MLYRVTIDKTNKREKMRREKRLINTKNKQENNIV